MGDADLWRSFRLGTLLIDNVKSCVFSGKQQKRIPLSSSLPKVQMPLFDIPLLGMLTWLLDFHLTSHQNSASSSRLTIILYKCTPCLCQHNLYVLALHSAALIAVVITPGCFSASEKKRRSVQPRICPFSDIFHRDDRTKVSADILPSRVITLAVPPVPLLSVAVVTAYLAK